MHGNATLHHDAVRHTSCLQSHSQDAASAEQLACAIADKAQKNAADVNFKSPWAVEAGRAGVLPFWQRFNPKGGKVDDCTVVVAFMQTAPVLADSKTLTPKTAAAV